MFVFRIDIVDAVKRRGGFLRRAQLFLERGQLLQRLRDCARPFFHSREDRCGGLLVALARSAWAMNS